MAVHLLLVLTMVLLLLAALSRKTPGGRTPLGVSRSNSNYQQRKLAGPPVKENPRAEIYELKKQKALRKLDRSIAKAKAEGVMATEKLAAAKPATEEVTATLRASPAAAVGEKVSLRDLLRLRRSSRSADL